MVVALFNTDSFRLHSSLSPGVEASPLLCCVAADNQQGTVQTVILKEMMNCLVFTEAVGTVTYCFPIAMKGIRRRIVKLHTVFGTTHQVGAVRNGFEGFDTVDVKLSWMSASTSHSFPVVL